MSRRTTGATFCAIAAFLFGVRYVVAAQLFVGMRPGEVSTTTLDQYLAYAGTPLLAGSIIVLVAGVAYLVWAEVASPRRRDHQKQ